MARDWQHGFPGGPEHPPTGPELAPVAGHLTPRPSGELPTLLTPPPAPVVVTSRPPRGPWVRRKVWLPLVVVTAMFAVGWTVTVINLNDRTSSSSPETPETRPDQPAAPDATSTTETTPPSEGTVAPDTTAPEDDAPATTVPDDIETGVFAAASFDVCEAFVARPDPEEELFSGAASTTEHPDLVTTGLGEITWEVKLPSVIASAAGSLAPSVVSPIVTNTLEGSAIVAIPIGGTRVVVGQFMTATGELLWQQAAQGVMIGQSSDVLWFANLTDTTTTVTGLDTTDGSISACFVGDGSPLTSGSPARINPTFGTLIAGPDSLYAYNAGGSGIEQMTSTGELHNIALPADEGQTTQLVAADDTVVVAVRQVGEITSLTALDAESNTIAWQTPVSDVFENMPATVAISGNYAADSFVMSAAIGDGQGWWQGATTALDATDGAVLWQNSNVGVQIERRMHTTDDFTYLVAFDADVVALADADGSNADPVATTNGIFVTAAGGKLVGEDLKSSVVLSEGNLLATANTVTAGTSDTHIIVVVTNTAGTSLVALPYDDPTAPDVPPAQTPPDT